MSFDKKTFYIIKKLETNIRIMNLGCIHIVQGRPQGGGGTSGLSPPPPADLGGGRRTHSPPPLVTQKNMIWYNNVHYAL